MNYNFYPVCHSVKPITSNLIFAVIGFNLSSIYIIDNLHKLRKKAIFMIMLLLYLIKKYKYIFYINPFFNEMNIILVSSGLFILFALIPIDKIQNNNIIFIIKHITSYTGGIYYLHPIFGENILNKWSKLVRYRTFRGCLLIYIITYFVCLIGSNLFRKSNFRYLFI